MKKKSSSTGSEPYSLVPTPPDAVPAPAPTPAKRKPRAPRATKPAAAPLTTGSLFDCVPDVNANRAPGASQGGARRGDYPPAAPLFRTPTPFPAAPGVPAAPAVNPFFAATNAPAAPANLPPLGAPASFAGYSRSPAAPHAASAKTSAKGKKKTGAPAGKRGQKNGWRDPCAPPPHPLGYRFLEEKPPLRATPFASIIPAVSAKYGFGRRLGVERFLAAWQGALEAVFGADDFGDSGYDGFDDYGGSAPGRLETFRKFSRPGALRGGTLRVEVASNLLANELQFQLPTLLAQLRARLPNEKIDQIKIVVH